MELNEVDKRGLFELFFIKPKAKKYDQRKSVKPLSLLLSLSLSLSLPLSLSLSLSLSLCPPPLSLSLSLSLSHSLKMDSLVDERRFNDFPR